MKYKDIISIANFLDTIDCSLWHSELNKAHAVGTMEIIIYYYRLLPNGN